MTAKNTENSDKSKATKGEAQKKELSFERDSRQIPAWHVIVLSVSSFGLYNIYWIYRNLSQLRTCAQVALDTKSDQKLYFDESTMDDQEKKDFAELKQEARGALLRLDNAGTREAFLNFAKCPAGVFATVFAVPVANLIILMRSASQFATLIPDQLSNVRKNALFISFCVALAYGALSLLAKLPGAWSLLYLSTALPLFVVQTWLNKHWQVYENEKFLARQAFNPLELGVIIVGASLFGLVLINSDFSH